MTRSDLDSVIAQFKASIDAHVDVHPLERLAWHSVKSWALTPKRIADVERRLVAAGVIQADAAPATAPATPAATTAVSTPAAS